MVMVSEAKCTRQSNRKMAQIVVTTEHLWGRYPGCVSMKSSIIWSAVVVTSVVVRVYLGSLEANSIKQSERKLAQAHKFIPLQTTMTSCSHCLFTLSATIVTTVVPTLCIFSSFLQWLQWYGCIKHSCFHQHCSVLRHFKRGNALEICDRVIFDFYRWLSHVYSMFQIILSQSCFNFTGTWALLLRNHLLLGTIKSLSISEMVPEILSLLFSLMVISFFGLFIPPHLHIVEDSTILLAQKSAFYKLHPSTKGLWSIKWGFLAQPRQNVQHKSLQLVAQTAIHFHCKTLHSKTVIWNENFGVSLSLPPDVASIAQYPELSIRFQLKAYWNINNLA